MNNARPIAAWKAVVVVWLSIVAMGMSACRQSSPTPVYQPTPTPGIRHRDALPLMLSLSDLGAGHALTEDHRLDKGPGRADRATRLSGYRVTYRGAGKPFTEVVCQVECYLSQKDAQAAYRTYKDELTTKIAEDERYSSVDASEASLGEWGWMFHMRHNNSETVHHLFLRENVLVETIFSGAHTPEFLAEAIRQAQVVDRRVLER